MVVDPIVVADVVLDAALAAGADAVTIEPAAQPERYSIAIARHGELLAVSTIDAELGIHTIARLGYVCQVDPGATRAATGRTRVRSIDTQKDLVVTIFPSPTANPRAELMFISPGETTTVSDPQPNDRIGNYQVVRQIGAGGMGDVLEVEHTTLRRRAALKILQTAVAQRDADSHERFVFEAQATARIKHPNVVEIYDFGYLPDRRPYFVMEMLHAEPLGDIMDRGPMKVRHAIDLAIQIANGLGAAHAQGVIHADVSPMNVLVERGVAKLIDFGLARYRETAAPLEPADHITGTPSYVSPEQLQGYAAIEASDQYSLGCVLFEMIAGYAPFDGESTTDICIGHVKRPAPRVKSPLEEVTPAVATVIARCLSKHPKMRYSSMAGLVEALTASEAGK
ncbi:MAG TPA: serine/threonine-protein kinase [Kofleriaceae bacterium]